MNNNLQTCNLFITDVLSLSNISTMLPVKIKPRLAYLIPAIGLNIVLVALVLDFYLVFSDKLSFCCRPR